MRPRLRCFGRGLHGSDRLPSFGRRRSRWCCGRRGWRRWSRGWSCALGSHSADVRVRKSQLTLLHNTAELIFAIFNQGARLESLNTHRVSRMPRPCGRGQGNIHFEGTFCARDHPLGGTAHLEGLSLCAIALSSCTQHHVRPSGQYILISPAQTYEGRAVALHPRTQQNTTTNCACTRAARCCRKGTEQVHGTYYQHRANRRTTKLHMIHVIHLTSSCAILRCKSCRGAPATFPRHERGMHLENVFASGGGAETVAVAAQ